MIRVELLMNDKVIRESLARIGIGDKKNKVLWPSCYLIKHENDYHIAHFKELFLLRDGGYNNISDEDVARLHSVVFCLKTWGMIDVDNNDIPNHTTFVFVLSHKNKDTWKISHKINSYSFEHGMTI
jgi:hypothetical protein